MRCVWLAIAFAGLGMAQAADVGQILKKVAETYRVGRSYEVVVSSALGGAVRVRFKPPNLARRDGKGGWVDWSDGTGRGSYMPSSNLYWFAGPSSDYSRVDVWESGLDLAGSYRYFTRYPQYFKLVGEQKIMFDDKQTRCYVLEMQSDAEHFKWRVEPTQFQVAEWEAVHPGLLVRFSRIRFDVDFPDEIFHFEPPKDARRVAPPKR